MDKISQSKNELKNIKILLERNETKVCQRCTVCFLVAPLSISLLPPRTQQANAGMDRPIPGFIETTQGFMDGHV